MRQGSRPPQGAPWRLVKFKEKELLPGDVRDAGGADYYWDNLSEGGDPKAQQCGWLKDTFGVFLASGP